MDKFKVGDMVWINSKSIDAVEDDGGNGEGIEVEIIKITPKRYKYRGIDSLKSTVKYAKIL